MRASLYILLLLSFKLHAVRITDTFTKDVVVQTLGTFATEEEALEEAFRLEDQFKNRKSSEYLSLKKTCTQFIGITGKTVVRLRPTATGEHRGHVTVPIRCQR